MHTLKNNVTKEIVLIDLLDAGLPATCTVQKMQYLRNTVKGGIYTQVYVCVYMKEYYLTIKKIESCHSRQHGWTLWTLC